MIHWICIRFSLSCFKIEFTELTFFFELFSVYFVALTMGIEKPILLFDGICKLCNTSVNFILKRDKQKQFVFVALQSERGEELVRQFNISKETDSVILIVENQVFLESEAAIEIARMLPAPWKWLTFFKIIPLKFRNMVYQWIARNRYRWFGKRNVCRII